MTQPSAAVAKLVDKSNNAQIGDRAAAITAPGAAITISSGGTATDTIDYSDLAAIADDIASVAAKYNELRLIVIELTDLVEVHGLAADN